VSSFASGLLAIGGMREAVVSTARFVLDGPHYRFSGRPPAAVVSLLNGLRVAAAPDSEAGFTVLVPTSGPVSGETGLDGRAVTLQLHDAVTAARAAVEADDPVAFDGMVTAGVSADFCEALSDLAGDGRAAPFSLRFGWAAARPAEIGDELVSFPEGAGRTIRAGATRLRGLAAGGPASIVGRIEGLHDDPGDRRRVRVRGELRAERSSGPRRAVWIRLTDDDAYQSAIEAHRDNRTVHADGELTSVNNRVELRVGDGGLTVRDTDDNPSRPEDDRAR
jgi:hypothetical protein